jgi:sugar/nucleoside kinase (ribokinase family)
VIVVIGSPAARLVEGRVVAAGLAATIARVAAAAGADVQLAGKVGEDGAGEAVLLALAGARVGHVAMLRDAGRPTPLVADGDDDDGVEDELADTSPRSRPPLSLEAADIELALRYLPDYRVVVIADVLDSPSTSTVVEATRWAGATLIALLPSGTRPSGLPDDATILEAPAADPDGAFAAVVGAYAAALDRGATPADAFASASGGVGWSTVATD